MSYDGGGGTRPPEAAPAGRAGPVLIIVVLAVMGALLTFLAMRAADDQHTADSGGDGDRSASEPPSELRFVPVREITPGPCAAGSGSEDVVESTAPVECLTLVPGSALEVARLSEARTAFDDVSGAGWRVLITFEPGDGERFADLTAQVANEPPPGNQIAIVLGDRLLTTPAVTGRVDGGELLIEGGFDQESAQELAAQLGG